MLNDTLDFDSADEYKLTGTETSPKDMVAVPMDRAGMLTDRLKFAAFGLRLSGCGFRTSGNGLRVRARATAIGSPGWAK